MGGRDTQLHDDENCGMCGKKGNSEKVLLQLPVGRRWGIPPCTRADACVIGLPRAVKS